MTKTVYDYIVVGKGLMGCAAARHLATSGATVALIGPNEPKDKTKHKGVFASHYDEGRITRAMDSSFDWSLLADRSIARYEEIAKVGNVDFFADCGALMAGPETGKGSDFMRKTLDVMKRRSIKADIYRNEELRDRFPYFDFPDGTVGTYERNAAGYISPRRLVQAQTNAATAKGADTFDDFAVSIDERSDGADVRTSKGQAICGQKVLIAAGGFTNAHALLPKPLALNIYARTIVFFELSTEEEASLAKMPSLVFIPEDQSCDPYLLPPIKYADGKTYLKIGGDPSDVELRSLPEMQDWFRSDGSSQVRDHLVKIIETLMPQLRYQSIHTGSCVTSFTPTGKPFIGHVSNAIAVLTGGNGAGAKCSDELGRLASKMLAGDSISSELYETDFALEMR